MARRVPPAPEIEPRQWTSADEIDRGIAKLNRRIAGGSDPDRKFGSLKALEV